MNLKEELIYRLSIGCDFIVKNFNSMDEVFTNAEKLQSISLLLTASSLLNRKSLKQASKNELNIVHRNIFSNHDGKFFLDNGKIITYNNIILASIYLKLQDKDSFDKTFNILINSLTDNSVSIQYPRNPTKEEVSFHLLPMIALLNFFSKKDTSNIDLSYYLAEVYNSYSIDISHEISYAVWLNLILGEYEGQELNLQNKAKQIINNLGHRYVEGMSSLYLAIYQQSLSFYYLGETQTLENNESSKILDRQFLFQLPNGAFIQRKDKPVSVKSTIHNLWSFILCLCKMNKTTTDSLF